MNINQKRGYHSPERVERANATARAILRAAETLFEAHGFAAVTMKTIAEHTGVALATVYLHFDGKAAILSALADEISSDPNLSVERVESAEGAEEQLREGVRILSALNARSWLVADILRSYSSADAGIGRYRSCSAACDGAGRW